MIKQLTTKDVNERLGYVGSYEDYGPGLRIQETVKDIRSHMFFLTTN